MLKRLITNPLLGAAESGSLPDAAIRAGIHLRLRDKIRRESRGGIEAITARKQQLLRDRASGPVTTHVQSANEQHYEVPAAFFAAILGPRLRYSSCYWPDGVDDLASAELAALEQTVHRAAIVDGDRVLELGAGWGSLSLFMAERFPGSDIVAVSNSSSQKRHIDAMATEQGLTNLQVHTADVATFEPQDTFDRVVSVEMFEHVRNHRELLRRIAGWLRPGGTCFVHVFSHRTLAWHFDADADGDWMARFFFAGGTMPSDDLLLHEQRHLRVTDHWALDGTHYARTLQAWLDRLDANRESCLRALAGGNDPAPPELQLSRWRLFLLSCIGTWSLHDGAEFGVSHYRFAKPS